MGHTWFNAFLFNSWLFRDYLLCKLYTCGYPDAADTTLQSSRTTWTSQSSRTSRTSQSSRTTWTSQSSRISRRVQILQTSLSNGSRQKQYTTHYSKARTGSTKLVNVNRNDVLTEENWQGVDFTLKYICEWYTIFSLQFCQVVND